MAQRILKIALAAAVGLAARVEAQTSTWPPSSQPGQQPSTTAPPPAQPAPRPGAPPAATAATPEMKTAIETVHESALRSVDIAKVAATKATSPKLKDLANHILKEDAAIDQQAQQFAQERGITLTPAAQVLALPQHQEVMKRANGSTGAEFDRFVANLLADDRRMLVSSLKQHRDKAPGKDARFKKWLDDVENWAESQSTAAFAARSEVNQTARQGRTPAK
jgi:putative membrane protein